MHYTQLDQHSVLQYLKNLPFFSNKITTETIAHEVGDGNLNYVYIIEKLSDGSKLVLKQSVPYLRCAGQAYHLDRNRMRYEYRSLQQFYKLCPQHIPKIYHVDDEMSLIVMQCLEQHIIMRKGLIAQTVYPYFVEHISDFMAHSLFKTSSFYLTGKEKRQLMCDYVGNDELCKITEDFVFTTAYMPHETNPENTALRDEFANICRDDAFKLNVLLLKNKFMNQTDALIHGDLHTGSIMINHNETFVIDSEFSFFGPMGFDVGALIANLLLAWISHFERSKNETYQKWLLDTAFSVYEHFERKFLSLWKQHENKENAFFTQKFCSKSLFDSYQKQYMTQLLRDTVGFTGLKMARRILGIAGVADIRDIEDHQARARAEKCALSIARTLVTNHQKINSLADLKAILNTTSVHDKKNELI